MTPSLPLSFPESVLFSSTSWSETFDTTLSTRWNVSNYSGGIWGNTFLALHVTTTQGMLGLQLSGEVQSSERHGFGTYTWKLRMSSTAIMPQLPGNARSGAVSGAFIYAPGAETELDFEHQCADPNALYMVTWKDGVQRSQSVKLGSTLYTDFHTYTIQWKPQSVVYLFDGREVGREISSVPQAPGYIVMNHWATNDDHWGGRATPNVDRWMWVESVSYTSW